MLDLALVCCCFTSMNKKEENIAFEPNECKAVALVKTYRPTSKTNVAGKMY